MAELNLFAGEDQLAVEPLGLSFFGDAGFGDPVVIGTQPGRTFVSDASGQLVAFEANNNKRTSIAGVVYGQEGDEISLLSLPNTLATANIRFTNSFAVQVLSANFHIFDGTAVSGQPNFTNDPTGVIASCAQIRNNSELQEPIGVGDAAWVDVHGATKLVMITSPGTSGLRPDGSLTTDTRHDWYIAISPSPTTPDNKFFGMYFELEFA